MKASEVAQVVHGVMIDAKLVRLFGVVYRIETPRFRTLIRAICRGEAFRLEDFGAVRIGPLADLDVWHRANNRKTPGRKSTKKVEQLARRAAHLAWDGGGSAKRRGLPEEDRFKPLKEDEAGLGLGARQAEIFWAEFEATAREIAARRKSAVRNPPRRSAETTSPLDKLLEGLPEEQPPGDVKPLEPEDFAAIMDFDEE